MKTDNNQSSVQTKNANKLKKLKKDNFKFLNIVSQILINNNKKPE